MNLTEKTNLLRFIDNNWGYFLNCANSYGANKELPKYERLTIKEYTAIVDKEIAKVENIEREFEAMTNSEVFRNEMKVLEHGFATATGSNWDKMIVEFRGEKYVIDDLRYTIEIANGENEYVL